MNRFLIWAIAAAGAAAAPAQPTGDTSLLLDSYAALVNGRVITVGQILATMQPVQERLAGRYDGAELRDKLAAEYENVRNELIESELILADFEALGGTLPDRAIEDHVNTVIHEHFNNDRAAFLQALSEERITFEEWRKRMKEQAIVQSRRQTEVGAKIMIAPLDLQTAYESRRADFSIPERVRLRTLALPATTKRTGAAKIRAMILAGQTTFEAVAAKGATLQDTGEFIEADSLQNALRDGIADLAPGGISEPVQIEQILYLVELVERQPARIRPLAEVAPEIEKEIRRAEFLRLNRIWMDTLRSKYYVQLFTHDLNGFFNP